MWTVTIIDMVVGGDHDITSG